ncbi:LuxR C-terminal-related transcriptional regulator [Kitasatospora sp. NPDC058218]|uniref:LuxR C-terminal-related transcriptional regulator n=1 Tax=Kitasatospora sp. NPDC058218 TaxID=3346385 RepID=UPI0036DC957C
MAEPRIVPDLLTAALPDGAARELYLSILDEGGRIRAAEVGAADEAALASLLQLGLLVPQPLDAAYTAVNPRTLGDRVGAELRATGIELLHQAEHLPDLLDDLSQAYDRSPHRTDATGGVQHVGGVAQIRHLLTQLAQEYPHESLTAQPGGARPAEVLADMLHHARGYLGRGGSIRTVYEPAARLDPTTAAYAAEVTRLGCAIRLLATEFTRLVIFDRTVAVVPADTDHTVAALVTDPAVVAFLVGVFEQQWRQAEGVNWSALAAGAAEPAVHDQIGRLLAQGLTQRAIANRLGLSERTVAGHISRLRELYDAETLFQLGWQMRGARTGESDG